jgi:hypothetical protein
MTPNYSDGISATPASGDLFDANDISPKQLDEETANVFRQSITQLLFLCKRARQDIQTAISSPFTCVTRHDIDDLF